MTFSNFFTRFICHAAKKMLFSRLLNQAGVNMKWSSKLLPCVHRSTRQDMVIQSCKTGGPFCLVDQLIDVSVYKLSEAFLYYLVIFYI